MARDFRGRSSGQRHSLRLDACSAKRRSLPRNPGVRHEGGDARDRSTSPCGIRTASASRRQAIHENRHHARVLRVTATTLRRLHEPELVRRWLLGSDGWTMPVCEIDFACRRTLPLRVAQRRSTWASAARSSSSTPRRIVNCRTVRSRVVSVRATNTTTFTQTGATDHRHDYRALSVRKRATPQTARAWGGMRAGFDRLETAGARNADGQASSTCQRHYAAAVFITVPRH